MYVIQISESPITSIKENLLISTIRNHSSLQKAVKSALLDPSIQIWTQISPKLTANFCQKIEKELNEFPNQSVFYFPLGDTKLGLSCFFAGNGHIF
jgi:hypothetical protein